MKKLQLSFLLAVAALVAACGSPDSEPTDECGPNGECPAGYTCDPVGRRCVLGGGGTPDAGTPDAMTPDAPEQLGCPTPTGGPTLHAGSISADEVWTANGSPHIVDHQLRVIAGATLTIEPCAEVQLGKDALIVAGFSGSQGTVRALGTEARPIVFKQKVAGERFDGIEAQYPATLDLAWVTVDGGGSNRFRAGASITGWGNSQLPTKPVLKLVNVTVKNSAGLGVLLERQATFHPDSDALTVTGTGLANGGEGEAVRIDSEAMGDVPEGNYTGNTLDAVTVRGSYVETATTIAELGVPYRISRSSSLVIREGGQLVLEPGVQLQLGDNSWIDIREGSLVASGTAEKPVHIGAKAGERWLYIQVGTKGLLSLTHTVVEGGGTDRFTDHAPIVARGDSLMPLKKIVHVDHVTVKNAGGTGILVERNAAFTDGSRDLVVTGSGATVPELGYAARIAQPAVHTLPAGTYTGNAIDEILADTHVNINEGEEIYRDRGVPYLVTGSVVVRAMGQDDTPPRLTIEPGVTIKFPKGLFGIIVGTGSAGSRPWPGELVAQGTADKPILFTSGAAQAAPGDWRGIYFNGYLPTGNVIEHARIEYAGASCLCSVGGCVSSEEAGVMFFTYPLAAPVVRNSTLASISGHGIYSNFWSDEPVDMTADNSFEGVAGCAQTMIADGGGKCTRECM